MGFGEFDEFLKIEANCLCVYLSIVMLFDIVKMGFLVSFVVGCSGPD